MEKVCKKCNIKKELSEFNRDKYSKDGYTSICKYCRSHRYELICELCGKSFRGSHKTQKFCSNKCKHEYLTGENNGGYKHALKEVRCDFCGKIFNKYKNDIDRTKRNFCSQDCSHKYFIGNNHMNFKNAHTVFKCDFCGKESIQKTSDYNTSLRHYCSTECMGRHRTIISRGKNNPNWRDGSSEKFNKIHSFLRNSTIDKWKSDSIEKCNGKCIITGKPYECVHHLYGHSKIVSEVLDILNLELKELKEYSNDEIMALKDTCLELHYKYGLGVCLTNEIHEKFHKEYGYGNNSPEQFYEFLNKINKKSA
ncbi:hypothetical protein FKF97_10995 [Clostridium perfringens]|nr:hypothetical protein [Clostridium perfringens]